MSVIVSCPKCQRKLKIEDNVLGKNIKCPGCTAVFATKAPAGAAPPPAKTAPEPPPAPAPKKAPPPPDDNGEDEAPRRPSKAAARDDDDDRPTKKSAAKAPRDDDYDDDRPAKKSAAKARDDDYDDDRPAKKPAAKKSRDDDYDEDDDRPKKSSKKGRDDDEDDRPAKKSAAKKGRDDEDDDRPAKKAKKKGGAGKVFAIIGVIVFLLCGGCVGAGWYFLGKVGGAVTDLAAKMTAPENRFPTVKAGPGLPGSDTKKTAGGPGGKPAGGKPGEKAKVASEQQLANAMYDDPAIAGTLYGPLCQLKGKVTKVTTTPDGKVSEIFFEPQVQDVMTRQKKPFPINCQLANPIPADLAPVGKGLVTVKGYLTGSKASATLTDCTLVFGP